VPKTPGVIALVSPTSRPPTRAPTYNASAGRTSACAAASLDVALASGATYVSDDWLALLTHPQIDIVGELATLWRQSSTLAAAGSTSRW
jgi:hypothetical protein